MPKVHKNILILISGIMWTGVGLFLIRLSFRWFHLLSKNELIFVIIAGVLSGIAIAYFGFSNLVIKNINRINTYKKNVCVWAFQKWTTYLLIIFMISLGIFMKNVSFIPKFLLSYIYIGMGLALFLSSFNYYHFLLKNKYA